MGIGYRIGRIGQGIRARIHNLNIGLNGIEHPAVGRHNVYIDRIELSPIPQRRQIVAGHIGQRTAIGQGRHIHRRTVGQQRVWRLTIYAYSINALHHIGRRHIARVVGQRPHRRQGGGADERVGTGRQHQQQPKNKI